jgi:hypothetical protein
MIQTSFWEEEEEIFIDPNGIKPRKIEEVITDKNIPKDTYIIYPSGGFHPFYGVPNTFPIYQEKIWPFVKRIKYTEHGRRSRGRSLNLSQLNCDFMGSINYPRINFAAPAGKKNEGWDAKMHRLVALSFIPNPKNKPSVMHRNNDQTNFLIPNLKWGTAHENNKGRPVRRPDTTEDKYTHMILQGIIKG